MEPDLVEMKIQTAVFQSQALASWLAIAASFIGPIIGVIIANMLSRQYSVRLEAAFAFRRIIENTHKYRHAFLNRIRHEKPIVEYGPKLERLKQILATTVESTDAQSRQSREEATILFQFALLDQQAVQERYETAIYELQNAVSQLQSDKLSLDMIFSKQSKRCEKLIDELLNLNQLFESSSPPSYKECNVQLNDAILKIHTEIQPMYETLRSNNCLCEEV
jgi:hypothetical protein